MPFLVISGFYHEPDPDNSLYYNRTVSQELETAVLTAMRWTSLTDVPPGETDLIREQAEAVLEVLGDPIRTDLMYSIGLFR